MFAQKRILAFIGARSGSKGLKNKNILKFQGKPLIHWSIQAALTSKYIDRVIVSTDSPKILNIAKKSGADTPFLRPEKLAQDQSSITDAIRHCIQWVKHHEQTQYDYIVMLQPTSPLRTSKHTDLSIEYYFKHRKTDKDTMVSVTQLPAKIGGLLKENKKGYIHFCFNVNLKIPNRQNNPPYYLPNGAIYFGPIKMIEKEGFYTSRTFYFLMPKEESIDIDTQQDFIQAKSFHQVRENKELTFPF